MLKLIKIKFLLLLRIKIGIRRICVRNRRFDNRHCYVDLTFHVKMLCVKKRLCQKSSDKMSTTLDDTEFKGAAFYVNHGRNLV